MMAILTGAADEGLGIRWRRAGGKLRSRGDRETAKVRVFPRPLKGLPDVFAWILCGGALALPTLPTMPTVGGIPLQMWLISLPRSA